MGWEEATAVRRGCDSTQPKHLRHPQRNLGTNARLTATRRSGRQRVQDRSELSGTRADADAHLITARRMGKQNM